MKLLDESKQGIQAMKDDLHTVTYRQMQAKKNHTCFRETYIRSRNRGEKFSFKIIIYYNIT